MSEKPSKNPYASVLTKGMNHNIDDDFALVTNKNGETYLRKRWKYRPGTGTPEQIKARETFADAISYARIHKETDFYKEEALFRKKSSYTLALQDFHKEPTLEEVEIWKGNTPEELRLVVVIGHPVTLMELNAELLDVTTEEVVVSGGMFLDVRDGDRYSLYFEKALLAGKEAVSVKLKLVSMTDKELTLLKSPVKVLKSNGPKTIKKP